MPLLPKLTDKQPADNHPVPKPPILGGPPDPITRALRDNAALKKDPNRDLKRTRTIIRRQQLLRTTGLYKGAIDGNWGPQSQHAWSIYVYRKQHGRNVNAPVIDPATELKQEKAANRQLDIQTSRAAAAKAISDGKKQVVTTRALVKRGITPDNVGRDNAQKSAAADDVAVVLKQQRDKATNQMIRLRADPAAAKALTLVDLSNLVSNPRLSGFDPKQPGDVRIVRSWLNTHGYKVAPEGKWDKPLVEEIRTAYHVEAVKQRNRAYREAVDLFYNHGGVVKGITPSWWISDQPLPDSHGLLKMLEGGGFTAMLLWKRMLASKAIPEYEYNKWRSTALDQIIAKLSPTWNSPNFFQLHHSDMQKATDIIMAASGVMGGRQQNVLRSQISVLQTSRTGPEFASRIMRAIRLSDRVFQIEQSKRAAHHSSFWGQAARTALSPITTPLGVYDHVLHLGKMAVGSDIAMALDIGDQLIHGDMTPTLSYKYADYWQIMDEGYQGASPVLRLADGFADPLIFARPFRAVSTVLKMASRAPALAVLGGLGGYTIKGEIAVIPGIGYRIGREGEAVARTGGLKGVEYTGNEWFAGQRANAYKALLRVPYLGTQFRRVDDLNVWMRDQIRQNRVFGYGQTTHVVPEGVELMTPEFKDATDVYGSQDMIARSRIRQDLRSNLAALTEKEVSLVLDQGRKLHSTVGAIMIGNMKEGLRVHALEAIAREAEADAFHSARYGMTEGRRLEIAKQHGVQLHHEADVSQHLIPKKGIGDTAAYEAAVLDEVTREGFTPVLNRRASRLAYREYLRIIDRGGSFIRGGGDAEITDIVNARVKKMSDLFDSLLIDMQRELEENAAIKGIQLFDENGLWAGRAGQAAVELRDAGIKMFEDGNLVALPNPMFDVPQTFEQVGRAKAAQISIDQARFLANAARAEMGGHPYTDEFIKLRLAKIEADVDKQYTPVGDHMYVDTRETIDVPAAYARQNPASAVAPRMPVPQAPETVVTDIAPVVDHAAGGSYMTNDDQLLLYDPKSDHLLVSEGGDPAATHADLADTYLYHAGQKFPERAVKIKLSGRKVKLFKHSVSSGGPALPSEEMIRLHPEQRHVPIFYHANRDEFYVLYPGAKPIDSASTRGALRGEGVVRGGKIQKINWETRTEDDKLALEALQSFTNAEGRAINAIEDKFPGTMTSKSNRKLLGGEIHIPLTRSEVPDTLIVALAKRFPEASIVLKNDAKIGFRELKRLARPVARDEVHNLVSVAGKMHHFETEKVANKLSRSFGNIRSLRANGVEILDNRGNPVRQEFIDALFMRYPSASIDLPTDTRTIGLSELRHMVKQAAERSTSTSVPRTFGLESLGAHPATREMSKVDYEIGRLTWALSGSSSDYTHSLLQGHMIGADVGDIGSQIRTYLQEDPVAQQGLRTLKNSLRMREDASYAIEQHLAAKLYMRKGAFMLALAHAQSAHFRVLYKGLDAALSVWLMASLPFRPGWMFRNVADNFTKTFIAGARDPRLYGRMMQRAGYGLGHNALPFAHTIFEAGVGDVLMVARFFDKLFGTDAAEHMNRAANSFWEHSTEVIKKTLTTHGISVSDEFLDAMSMKPFGTRENFTSPRGRFTIAEADVGEDGFDPAYAHLKKQMEKRPEFKRRARYDAGKGQSFRDAIWELMANKPETASKRMLYESTVKQSMKDGDTQIVAEEKALQKIKDTLFDYSDMAVAESNLRHIVPFIQFWRKNTVLWIKNFATEPWLTVELSNYIHTRDEIHKDWPDWMKHYVNSQEIVDAAAVIPGLGPLVDAVLPDNAQFDPLSMLSFSTYMRAFEGVSAQLPGDKQGWPIIGPMIDAMNDWGVSINPFIRKPLESAGIASTRAWMTVFPETSLASAMTREYFGDVAAGHVLDWERIFTLMQGGVPSDQLAANFEQYVRREMVDQIARGEEPDRKKAEATIRTWFLTQNLHGFFGGAYWRKNSPEDFYMAQMQDEIITGGKSYADLTDKQKTLLSAWNKTGIDKKTGLPKIDRLTFDRYVENIPLIEAYFALPFGSPESHQFLIDHPNIIQYTDPLYTKGMAFSKNYVAAAVMYMKGAEWFDVNRLMRQADLPHDMREAARATLVTPELQDFWAKNDTPAQMRSSMISGELHSYLNDIQATYFSIPEKDYAARTAFLDEHPELVQSWNANNTRKDDFEAMNQSVFGDLRTSYFHIVKEHGFDQANKLLKQFPFMFEGTASEGKVDEKLGIFVPGGKGSKQGDAYIAGYKGIQHFFALMKKDKNKAFKFLSSNNPDAKLAQAYFDRWGKHHNAPRAIAFRKARHHLRKFFNMRDHGHAAAAYAWLNSDDPGALIAKDYLKKWSKTGSYHAQDFLRAEKWLLIYWNLPVGERAAWLRSKTPGAEIARKYFAKWADDKKGMTAQAIAWAHAKHGLDHYFSLSKAEKKKWLAAGSPDAKLVLDYFKRFSASAKFERAFAKQHPGLLVTDPEVRSRLDFWKTYYGLTPDQRPAYVLNHAADHGVFIFGALGDGDAHDREMKFIRDAMAATVTVDGKKKHLNEKAATYLYVKPLLDQLYTLSSKDRPTFIAANPELGEYLDVFGKKGLTGNPKLDKKIEQYFALPQGSLQRADYLQKNPDIQHYFNQHSTPQERAMRNLLEVFFSLSGDKRKKYGEKHPEIQVYFDRSRAEKSATAAQMAAFEQADPRLHQYFEDSKRDLVPSAARMRANLRAAHIRQYTPDAVAERRDRTPAPDSTV